MTDAATILDEQEATLLLVDDRPENLLALEAVLEPLGHRLVTATTGEEALRCLLVEDVAVILLDVQMPVMDGFETARRIKERERNKEIPILFLTAEAGDIEQAMRGFSSGAVDYVTKPVHEWLLRAKVQVFVDLALKTRILQRHSLILAERLDEQYEVEERHLRKLADAAIVINSSLSLAEMLKVINESAREIIGAHEAETVLVGFTEGADSAQSRAFSPKYAMWAREGNSIDLTPIYKTVWQSNRPVRMTKKEIQTSLAARGLAGIMPGHPLLEGWLAVPVMGRSSEEPLALIQVADKIHGDFTGADEAVLGQLADLAAVAIENAARFEHEHRTAEILQRSLLPEELPRFDKLDLAAFYQPGGRGTEVGGDWYDVFRLNDGRIALILGDVAGHGLRAAAVMGQLRTALRAYALRDLTPADVLADVDVFLQEANEGAIATVVLIALDPVTRLAEIVSAGHLPPLVIDRDGERTFLEVDSHQPLGVVTKPVYRATQATLPEQALVVLYSDGLIEERAESLDEGLERLADAIDPTRPTLDEMCDVLVAKMAPNGKEDDVTVLAARIRA